MAEFSIFGNLFLLFVNICFFIFSVQLFMDGSKSDLKKKLLNTSITIYLATIIHDLSLVVFAINDFFFQHVAFLLLIIGVEIYTVIYIDEVIKRLARAENKLYNATIKLQKINKLEALGLIHTQTTHEMKNIMHSIDAWAQSLKFPNRNSSRAIEGINRSIYHLNDIITEIQHFSKNDKNRSIISIEEMIGKLEFFSQKVLLKYNVTFTIEKSEDSLTILCNVTQIIQALLNLIINSCEAISDSENSWIKISFDKEDTFLRIRITDSGNARIIFKENYFSTPLRLN